MRCNWTSIAIRRRPPRRVLSPEDCCNGGCDRCVFVLYEEALERYEQALRAWRERHPER